MIQELQKNYGHIFDKELIEAISEVGTLKEVTEGFKLMEVGQYVKSMPLLLNGAIKIMRDDDNGDELLLYFLEKGDTCAMTLSCCIAKTKSEIRAIAEMDTKLIMVPIEKMEVWTSEFKSWRNFVFDSYHNRLMELLETVDKIAFLKMDERLLEYLRSKAKVNDSDNINSTHQEIAYELHSSRVVISRLLKKLENQGLVKLNRNSIKILSLKM